MANHDFFDFCQLHDHHSLHHSIIELPPSETGDKFNSVYFKFCPTVTSVNQISKTHEIRPERAQVDECGKLGHPLFPER